MKGVLSKVAEAIVESIHHRKICAMLECMKGSRIASFRCVVKLKTARARRVPGPHSFEYGKYVYLRQFTHWVLGG